MSLRSSSGAALTRTSAPADARGAVLVLHGGSADSTRPVARLSLAALRLVFVARSVARWVPDTAVYRLRNSIRGWNGDGDAVLGDARWALARITEAHPAVPIVVVGHSLGGRVAAYLARDGRPSPARSGAAVGRTGGPVGRPIRGTAAADRTDVGTEAVDGGGPVAVTGAVLLAPWLEPADPVTGLRGVPIEVVQGTRDRMIPTPSTEPWLTRATAAGAAVRRSVVDGGEHTMLRHHRQWHRLTVAGVVRVLQTSARPA